MFLKYLSDQECDKRYWPFVFRFETLVSGVVMEASRRIDGCDDEQAKNFFFNVFASALDENSGVTPPGWWLKIEPPPYQWYREYIEREAPYMVREARRLAQERLTDPQKLDEESKQDFFDREKIHHCAHVSDVFRDFLASR